jgi:Zn-dependent peptidase ImmA (M78 family)
MSSDSSPQLPKQVRWEFVCERARELTDVYSTPPIPVFDIAEQRGVNVVFASFGRHSETISGFCDFAAARLYVNENDSSGRKMFTIAHELGHWLLHRDFIKSGSHLYRALPRFKAPSESVLEKEANLFAAELLVPRSLVLPVKDASVSQLADIFAVSRTMMEWRLKNV